MNIEQNTRLNRKTKTQQPIKKNGGKLISQLQIAQWDVQPANIITDLNREYVGPKKERVFRKTSESRTAVQERDQVRRVNIRTQATIFPRTVPINTTHNPMRSSTRYPSHLRPSPEYLASSRITSRISFSEIHLKISSQNRYPNTPEPRVEVSVSMKSTSILRLDYLATFRCSSLQFITSEASKRP